MDYNKLADQSIIDVLKSEDTNLSAVGEAKGIMAIFVKCTMDIGKKLNEASQEIKNFNESTTKLNKRLLWLDVMLTIATLIGAIATG